MLWLRALGSWVRGLLFNQRTRLVKRPSGEGTLSKGFKERGKRTKQRKKCKGREV